ncbi:TPA_asm: coat protein [ssRNA phage SRR7976323_5]|uniref:Coat protein n=1 Tax=ssRNA phage SRR7976323_5 TaxID=2786692 RepID=A0A8S5L1D3_9VIRU|nr:coat protein [ssRNA phage SRR7976323_5]DAD51157.1 TPA_asm: coat protein [ssRNA phage SRR7976323_5]
MFTDPISVTIASVATSFPRVGTGNLSSVYRSADGMLTLDIGHQDLAKGTRESTLVRLTRKAVGSDPLNSALSKAYESRVHLVFNTPANGVGISDATVKADIQALCAWIGTSGNLDKLLGKES